MEKKWVVFYCFLLILFLNGYTNLAQSMRKEFGAKVRLTIDEGVVFEDGMRIELIEFFHEHDLELKSIDTFVQIRISNGSVVENEYLSIYGEESTYDSLVWNEYTIHLKEMYYDKAIVIVVERK